MKIYIPKHLRSLEIIEMFRTLIQGYQDANQYSEYSSTFSDFYGFYLSSDPVKRFLDYVVPASNGTEEGETLRTNTINYLSQLFYSVKGSYRVVEYFKDILGERYLSVKSGNVYGKVGDIVYDGNILTVPFTELIVYSGDAKYFNELLLEFFNSLLYFSKFGSPSDDLELNIVDTVTNNVAGKGINYKEILV